MGEGGSSHRRSAHHLRIVLIIDMGQILDFHDFRSRWRFAKEASLRHFNQIDGCAMKFLVNIYLAMNPSI